MLWLAQPTRRRFTLHVRHGDPPLQVWNSSSGTWDGDTFAAVSPTALVHLYQSGRYLDFRSRNGYSQRVLFFDASDGRSIGTIEVNASGAFMVRKGVEGATVTSKWPALWTAQAAAIVRVHAPVEICVTDRQGEKKAPFRTKRDIRHGMCRVRSGRKHAITILGTMAPTYVSIQWAYHRHSEKC